MISVQESKMKELLNVVKKHVDDIYRVAENGGYIIDPNDGKSIEGHYAASHAAVAYMLYGYVYGDDESLQKANVLLQGIINKWESIKKETDFHADFNLFALCLYYDFAMDFENKALLEKLKKIVLSTNDSSHKTINWLPMRIYVNKSRYEWTGEKRYQEKIKQIEKVLSKVIYSDYYIDDRSPVGISFNVQYNIATVASLYLLGKKGVHLYHRQMVDAILNIVLPDGDVNYLGRGCNQIFAWGPWLYLLYKEGFENNLENALDFFLDRIEMSLDNNNILLNTYAGHTRWLWWDYHHYSVYLCHLFMWLVLALVDEEGDAKGVEEKFCLSSNGLKSGIDVFRNKNCMIVSFEGRREYLAETGPAIYALWLRNTGVIFKGAFAPWFGMFGNKYSNPIVALSNYFGLLEVSHDVSHINNRITRILDIVGKCKAKLRLKPIYIKPQITFRGDSLIIDFYDEKKRTCILNIPSLRDIDEIFHVCLDGVEIPCYKSFINSNQYGECSVYETGISSGIKWSVSFRVGASNE